MRRSRHAIQGWLQARNEHWHALARGLDRQLDEPVADAKDLMALVQGMLGLARDLALAREEMPENRITAYLEQLYVRAHEMVYRPARNTWQDLKDVFSRGAPRVMREIRVSLLATLALFSTALVVGWLLVAHYPELAALFASPEMIDQTQQGRLWTDDLLNVMPSSVLSFAIIANNLTVTLFAFVLGAFFGLGTLYIIALNGLMLGGVFAFTSHYGLHGGLFDFVVPHGVVELSVICVAGAAGVGLGEALLRPGARTRSEAFQAAVSRAGILLVVALPFLVGAGLIEGFISPDPAYSRWQRVVIGSGYGLTFWLVLSGLIVRREPLRRYPGKPTHGGGVAAPDSA